MEKKSSQKNPVLDSLARRTQLQKDASKLKGLNAHLSSVLQKRVRLDIEIKQIKRRMVQLRKRTTAPKNYQSLAESAGLSPAEAAQQYLQTIGDLNEYKDVLTEADKLLAEVAVLPLLE